MLNRGRLLLGGFPTAEQAGAFGSRVSPLPPDWFRARWPAARQSFLATLPPPTEPPTDLDGADRVTVEEILRAPLFRATLAQHRWRLVRLAIGGLAIFQPLVNLSRVEAIGKRLAAGLVAVLFPVSTTLDVATDSSAGPTVSFISSRSELTVSSAALRRLPGSGAIEVAFQIEPRPNYVSILDAHGFRVLRNGHHRLVTAWRAGFRHIPCVLVEGDLSSLSDRFADGFSAEVLRAFRPPRLTDFVVSGEACIEIDLRPRHHVLRLRTEREAIYESLPAAGEGSSKRG